MLNSKQYNLIQSQIKAHQHKRYTASINLDDKQKSFEVEVFPEVLRPEVMTSKFFARFLYKNKQLYKDKRILDMGCGCGIQGILMALNGAKEVVMTDVAKQCIKNTNTNIIKHNLDNVRTKQSDLFRELNSNKKFDLISFNHPFFPDNPIADFPVSSAMLDSGDLIKQFFQDAKKFLSINGIIVMPFLEVAGETNDPGIQAKKFGYTIFKRLMIQSKEGLQKGRVIIYQIVHKKLMESE